MAKLFPEILKKLGFLQQDRITGEIKTSDGSSVVTVKKDDVTGGSTISTPTSTVQLPVGNLDLRSGAGGGASTLVSSGKLGNKDLLMWLGRRGWYDAAVNTTFQTRIGSPVPFDSVQLIFTNTNTVKSPTVVSGIISSPSTAAEVNNSTSAGWISNGGTHGNWVAISRMQASNFSLECPVANTDPARDRLTMTDRIQIRSTPPTDGGSYHWLTARAYMLAMPLVGGVGGLPVGGDGSVTVEGDDYSNWATKPDGNVRHWRVQTGNCVTDPTTFTSTINMSQCPIVGAIFYCRGKVVNIWTTGDSNSMAAGATYRGDGFGQRVCSRQNALNTGIGYFHSDFSWSGQSSNTVFGFAQRTLDHIERPELPIDFLLYQTASPNDSLNYWNRAIIDQSSYNNTRVLQAAEGRGAIAIGRTVEPVYKGTRDWSTGNADPAFPGVASDTLRIALNARSMAMNALGNKVIDVAALIPQDAPYLGQEQPMRSVTLPAAGMNLAGGIHFNDPVFELGTDQYQAYIVAKVGVLA
jgi:hypothetical protein